MPERGLRRWTTSRKDRRGPGRLLGFVFGLLRVTVAGAVTAAFVWLCGFLWFGFALPQEPDSETQRTDAIVVLTGGAGRIEAGMQALQKNLAPVLFLTGVNPRVDRAEILRLAGNPPPDIAQRIQLGYRADTTRGNAAETAAWFNSRNLRSLRLVTGHYHMRRSAIEFARDLPRARIVRHPVVPPGLGPKEWWTNERGVLTMLREYNKFLGALVLGPLGWSYGA